MENVDFRIKMWFIGISMDVKPCNTMSIQQTWLWIELVAMGAAGRLGVLLSFGCFVVLLVFFFVFFLNVFFVFFCFCLMMGWGGAGWDVNVYVHVTLMMLRLWWGGVGWGGMLTFMFMLRWWCYICHGVGWDVNVHVHVTLMMLRWSWGWGGVGC